ncbi:MAG: hypothetical protein A3K19_30195 [Lentisphaerae bacterium RIFOXYB12_FULL_65_16]|nr:MAG: hypothetical protein A3K18_29560 [Lentisphaerae bacterium RIFOXYA12_64_32]OGV85845.1 MAG: hypothetical protein A3K19_30195 [Lentisphaerae bacterium RIFOXYB12_FULL_65_16]
MSMHRRLAGWAGLVLAGVFGLSAGAATKLDGTAWVMENDALNVSVATDTGRLSVLHKTTGLLWAQEDPRERQAAEKPVTVRRCATPPVIDGDAADWPNKDWIWLPWVGENGEANLSGGAQVMWDDQFLYVHVRMRDDQVAFGGESTEGWWEADSVELWIDSVQVGLHLCPGKEAAVDSKGVPFKDARLAVKLIPSDKLPGYAVELAMPLAHFPVLRDPVTGIRFHLAVGENDADPKPGEPVRRKAQGYFPSTWVHSVPATFAVAVLADTDGTAPPLTRDNDRTIGVGDGAVANVRKGSSRNAIAYDLSVARGQPQPLALAVELSLLGDDPVLDVRITCTTGDATRIKTFQHPAALFPPAPETYFMATANGCDGRYVPVGDKRFRASRLATYGYDMPWVAVTDGRQGMVAITMTPADSFIQMQSRCGDEARLGFPGFGWQPSKGTFAVERLGRLVFYDQGGHVKACKIYRGIAREQKLVRTLTEKAKANPDVHKLMGAVDWWGGNGVGFVREAVAAGMTHGLVNGRWSPEAMAEMVRLGWLVGEYDNYVDIDDSPTIDREKAPVAEHAVVKEDGEFMTAWISRDKDMNPTHTFMKHCTAKQVECAKVIIPELLKTHPYNARFLDVTPAEGLIECYSTVHPTTRSSDIANRQALCRYVSEEVNLVTGGEHGRFWSAPVLHYHEGMMGGGFYSWPAGYLRDPKDRSEISQEYLDYGINPANRAPLYELVFHDCVVNYWYWGACSDYLHQVAPELTDRKTAMNILYGTPPMMWVNNHGLRWQVPEERELMLTIYRNVCKLHEVIGMQEMVAHVFLSPDRMVQQTEFADGTVCTVNFGKTPFQVRSKGPDNDASIELLENDFHVRGPHVEQWRVTAADGVARSTFIRTDTFLFAETGPQPFAAAGVRATGQATVILESPDRARIVLGKGATLELAVADWRPAWKRVPRVLLALDAEGRPEARAPGADAESLTRRASADAKATYLLLADREAEVPDVTIASLTLSVGGKPVSSGTTLAATDVLDIACEVRNAGMAAAKSFDVALHLDGPAGPELLRKHVRRLGAGGAQTFNAPLIAGMADGTRQVVAQVLSEKPVSLTGRTEAAGVFTGPCTSEALLALGAYSIEPPAGDSAGMPVEVPFSLARPDGQAADPANLRVRFDSGTVVPAQFESASAGTTAGTLVFCLPPDLKPGVAATAQVLGVAAGDYRVFPHASGFDVAADGSRLRFATYSVSLAQGTLSDIAVRTPQGTEQTAAAQIIVSAKETGWSKEDGAVEALTCLQRGPVRCVFAATKVLKSAHRVTRTWYFYADRFEVDSAAEPKLGTLTRAFYAQDATASNETGKSVQMDGEGDAEEFGFKGTPTWYAVFNPQFRNACIALTPPSGFTYWDGGARGQISLNAGADAVEKRVYIWGPGAPDDTFAKAAAQAYAQGTKVLPAVPQ